jgi:hypothetical protein
MTKYNPKARNRSARWTDEDRDLLRTLAERGVPHEYIARRLKRTRGSVTAQLYLMRQQGAVEAPPTPSLWRRIVNFIRPV